MPVKREMLVRRDDLTQTAIDETLAPGPVATAGNHGRFKREGNVAVIPYGSSLSPFCRKVSAYAAEKGPVLESVAAGLVEERALVARTG